MSKRKIFHLDTDLEKENPITSGGVIIYRFINNNMELLLIESRGGFEDLGGRIDETDKNIYTTISREAYEESNCILDIKNIKTRLKSASFIYNPRSKYIVYIIEANKYEMKLLSNDFGDHEIYDDIVRTINWIPLDIFLLPDIIKHKLNWRLKSKKLFDLLKTIQIDKKMNINMFLT